ncbi:MAG: 30S ribosomal protein S20 [Fimbriimonadaceae bacterium]|nr:30S ribosomal protein S20 [Fimbriimonadaceae bacterium]
MANLKSSKKDIRRNRKARERNSNAKTALKTYVKKVRVAVSAGETNVDNVKVALATAIKALDKASQHGIIHKNQAARRKSRIARLANSLLVEKSQPAA